MISFSQFLTEIKNISGHQQSHKDVSDAKTELRTRVGGRIKDLSHIESKLDSFKKPHKTERIPIELIDVLHHEANKNGKKYSKNPIIAMKNGQNRFHVLDGNHRVNEHKKLGHTHIESSVVKPKWTQTSKYTHHSSGELEE